MDVDLRVFRCLVRSTYSRKLFDLTRSRLLVETFGVTLFGLFHGNVNKDLYKWQRRVDVFGICVEVTGELAIGFVRGDEGCQGDGCGIGEEFGYLRGRSLSISASGCSFTLLQLRTSAIRRMFSSRSLGENPRSLFNPNRTLSPSSL